MVTAIIARRALYSGTVQGVGFRNTCQRIAQKLPINGYVRNLQTGQVELIAEGLPGDVSNFMEKVQKTMAAYIQNSESCEVPIQDLRGFEIRF